MKTPPFRDSRSAQPARKALAISPAIFAVEHALWFAGLLAGLLAGLAYGWH